MKKEFEGAAATSSSSQSFEPGKLVTIPDENQGGQSSSINPAITPEGSSAAASTSTKETAAAVSDESISQDGAAALPPAPPPGSGGSKVPLAAKLEATRKFSQTISSGDGAEFDIEDEDDFDPHFQRVYISGDDNTGVRQDFWPFREQIAVALTIKILGRSSKNGPGAGAQIVCVLRVHLSFRMSFQMQFEKPQKLLGKSQMYY